MRRKIGRVLSEPTNRYPDGGYPKYPSSAIGFSTQTSDTSKASKRENKTWDRNNAIYRRNDKVLKRKLWNHVKDQENQVLRKIKWELAIQFSWISWISLSFVFPFPFAIEYSDKRSPIIKLIVVQGPELAIRMADILRIFVTSRFGSVNFASHI